MIITYVTHTYSFCLIWIDRRVYIELTSIDRLRIGDDSDDVSNKGEDRGWLTSHPNNHAWVISQGHISSYRAKHIYIYIYIYGSFFFSFLFFL